MADSFVSCYVVELEGKAPYEVQKQALKQSIETFMADLPAFLSNLVNTNETLTIRIGKVDCKEKKPLKKHSCLTTVILSNTPNS